MTEFQTGRFDEADRLLREAIAVRPQSADAYSTHAAILYELGRFDEALARSDQALKIKPDADTFNIRGNAMTGLRRLEDAVASSTRRSHASRTLPARSATGAMR